MRYVVPALVSVCVVLLSGCQAVVPGWLHGKATAPVWRNLGPGGGGWIQSICAGPYARDELLVGCDVGGFYISGNAGDSYTIYNTGLEDYFVECIVPHPTNPDIIYLGCESGMHKSTDHGRSWTWLRNGFPPPQRYSFSAPIGAVAIDPNCPDIIYAGIGRPRRFGEGKGAVYRSMDGGGSWTRINVDGSLPGDAVISDIVIDPRDSAALLLASSAGVYRSRDSGLNWELSSNGLPHRHARRLAVCRAYPDTVYVTLHSKPGEAPWQGGVYKSVDGGLTWSPCNNGLRQSVGKPGEPAPMTCNYDRIVAHPTDPAIAYVGGTGWVNANLWKTTDGGTSWQELIRRSSETCNIDVGWITMWGPTVQCLSMSPLDPDVLYFGTSGMVYRTGDGGRTWQQKYARQLDDGRITGTGLEVTCLHNIVIDPGNSRRIFFSFYDIGLLISEDGGETFRRCVGSIPRSMANSCFTVVVDPADPAHLWGAFGTWSANKGIVAESADGGRTWTPVDVEKSGLPNCQNRVLIVDETSPAASRRLFVTAKGHGVFVSNDGGKQWEKSGEGLPHGNIVGLIRHPTSPGTFWCLLGMKDKELGALYRSDDACRSWRRVSKDLVVADPKALVVSSGTAPRLYISARDRKVGEEVVHGGVFRSDDGGVTWKKILEDDFVQSLAVDPRDPDVVYAGLTDHPYHDKSTGDGILMSRDGGRHWVSLNTDRFTCKQPSCIALAPDDPDRIYVGTGGNAVFTARITAAGWRNLPAW